jgi:hypothetical protein
VQLVETGALLLDRISRPLLGFNTRHSGCVNLGHHRRDARLGGRGFGGHDLPRCL